MQFLNRIFLISIAIFLTACASGVTKLSTGNGDNGAPVAIAPNVNGVNVQLSENAKKLVADNTIFNQESLKATVERVLNARALQQSTSTQSLDIEVTSFRTRSNVAAVLFGFMAGNDNIEGIVSVKDAKGTILKKVQVSASYALGGYGGGQNDARMSWLYEEFAKHVAAEIGGVPAK